ncbi:MAG: hypothetical protein BZY88_15715 [SAR202 cluster bacterium Io17-Chloro-G9]|nr:MAG: hypothetical protein BZY88_15715 [SAR202 cluster bacterium Io17-Chloro-G9]
MLSEFWLAISLLLVFIGLLASQGLLLVVGSLVTLVWLAAKLWDRYGFRRVTHSRSISRERAFVGDTLDYAVTLNNDKLLPLIWVDIQDNFPEGLDLPGGTLRGSGLEVNRQHTIITSLLPYQRVTWKYSLKCVQRGYQRIGPVRLRSGDIFGFSAAETRLGNLDHVLVYPTVLDMDRVQFPPEHPLGQVRGQLPIYLDHSRVAGQREYRSDDPLKHIHWKATARAGELQTKVFEPAVSLNLLVVMNGLTNEYIWQGNNRRLFERAVTAAASMASLADRRGFSYGLISNAVASYSGKWLSVPVGASQGQLPLVLEALAMAAPFVVAPLTEVMESEKDFIPPGATVMLVTSALTASLAVELESIKNRGYRATVLYAGDGVTQERFAGIPVVSVTHLLDTVSVPGSGPQSRSPEMEQVDDPVLEE